MIEIEWQSGADYTHLKNYHLHHSLELIMPMGKSIRISAQEKNIAQISSWNHLNFYVFFPEFPPLRFSYQPVTNYLGTDFAQNSGPSQYKDRCRLTSIGIPMLNIRRSHDRLIFKMGRPIPGNDCLYIETGPRLCLSPSPGRIKLFRTFNVTSYQQLMDESSKCQMISVHF